MNPSRRSVLSALGVALPFGLGTQLANASSASPSPAPALGLRTFEQSVRQAFDGLDRSPRSDAAGDNEALFLRRIEIGHSEQVRVGVQGCHNDRPFAGFPAGHLRITRVAFEPGPIRQGIRLYVATLDVVLTGGLAPDDSSRPLNFASLPSAPTFS